MYIRAVFFILLGGVLIVAFQDCGRLGANLDKLSSNPFQSPTPSPASGKTFCPNGGTWSLIDDYQKSAGNQSLARSIVQNAAGELLVAGAAYAGVQGWTFMIRKSTDLGNTWTIDDESTFDPGTGPISTLGYALAINANGDLFAPSYTFTSNYGWLMRRKISGLSWENVDYFGSVTPSFPEAVALGSNNSVYVSGSTRGAPNRWLVRKSGDNALNWSTVDDYTYTSGKNSKSRFITAVQDKVYSVGYGEDSNTVKHWIVRRSQNSGISWVNQDDYQLSVGKESDALIVASAPNGDLFVTGYGKDISDRPIFLVKKSSDQGYTWSVVYQFDAGLASGDNFFDGDIEFTSDGDHIVSVNFKDNIASTVGNLIFAGDKQGKEWRLFEKFHFPGGGDTRTDDLMFDKAGSLYAVGPAQGGNSTHWVVRRLKCN